MRKINIKKVIIAALALVLAVRGSSFVFDVYSYYRNLLLGEYLAQEERPKRENFSPDFSWLENQHELLIGRTSGTSGGGILQSLLNFVLSPQQVFAAPPTTAYTPGETLDPSCSPGGTNCTVNELPAGSDTQIQYNNGGSFGGATSFVFASTTGNVGIGTTSPYAKLSVGGEVVAGYFTATTTATSTLAGGLSANLLNITSTSASSTFANGINLTAGCFAISGTCVGGAGGSGTVNSGTTGYVAYYASDGTAVSATSTLFISTTVPQISIGTTTATTTAILSVDGGIFVSNPTGSVAIGNTTLSATGTSATAVGVGNLAGGLRSSSVGYSNSASASNSSAFGRGNTASGSYSSAFGRTNTASGSNASAFGRINVASGSDSSAFGYSNTASGNSSSAFGYSNTAINTTSVAFGYNNIASSTNASAFGVSNTATSTGSSAFGYSNQTAASDSSAFGRGNIASGANSSAFGYGNTASGNNSSSIGMSNTVSGYRSSASGYLNTVSNTFSSAFGYFNTVSGTKSSASGYKNTASGDNSLSFGWTNTASGLSSSAFGYTNTASSDNSVAIGSNNTASVGGQNVAVGVSNTVSVSGALVGRSSAFGYSNSVTGSGIASAFGTSNSITSGGLVVGYSNTVSGANSIAVGMNITNSIDSSAMFGPSNTAKLTILSTGETQAPYFTATTTGATSTFKGLSADLLQISSTTATSTFANGINLTAGCFAISGTCITGSNWTVSGSNIYYNTGNVGIGTSSPYAKLSVVGETVSTYFTATSTIATSTLAGRVFFGTTTPTFTLSSQASTTAYIDGFLNLTSTNRATVIGDTSGNNRGLRSLDIQPYRTAATQVSGGLNSVALGNRNTASGAESAAVGVLNSVSSYNSSAFGLSNTVSSSGGQFTAVGYNNTLSGTQHNSSAFGVSNSVSTGNSSAFGLSNSISGSAALGTAVGYSNTVTGNSANAFGVQNTASGSNSLAIGDDSVASASFSAAIGYNVNNNIATSIKIGPSGTAHLHILSTGETLIPFVTATTTGATSTFKGLSADLLHISTTTATSTFAGNLHVQGTLRSTFSYVGDLIFANNFRFTEGPLDGITQYLHLQNQNGDGLFTIDDQGNMGLGTTTPQYKLHVVGDVAANSFINTSTRGSKTDITYLKDEDYEGFLNKLNDINIATYRYNTDDQALPINRMGLIAEEAPSEVLSASQNGVDIYKLASFNLGITKVLSKKLADLELKVKDIESLRGTGGDVSMSAVLSYLESLGTRISAGVASFTHLITGSISIGNENTPTAITVYDKDGKPGCMTIEDVNTGAYKITAGTCPVYNSQTVVNPVSDPTTDTEAPVLTINGNNPATIQKGQSYVDLGALVTDNVNNNLGITTTGDQIDTTIPGTYTVTYSATDQAGNTATSTRTVIVEDPAQIQEDPQPEPEEPITEVEEVVVPELEEPAPIVEEEQISDENISEIPEPIVDDIIEP